MTGPTEPRDPYDATPRFPTHEFDEVRPDGGAFRRGKGWLLVVAVGLALGGVIAWDKWSKSSPAEASPAGVYAYGVGDIPLKDTPSAPAAEKPTDQEKPREEKKQEKKKVAAKPPRKRESVLGMANALDDPSHAYAQREVSSWNPRGGKETVAKRRETALGR